MDFEKEINKSETSNVPQEKTPQEVINQILNVFKFMKYKKKRIGKHISTQATCQLFTDTVIDKKTKSDLRVKQIALGFEPKSNNNMPIFEDIQLAKALFDFAKFNQDCTDFTIIEVDTEILNNEDYKLYLLLQEFKNSQSLMNTSEWNKFIDSNNLSNYKISSLSEDPKVIQRIEAIENVDNLLIEFDDLNAKLPNGSYLINQKSTPLFYIESYKAYKQTLKGIYEQYIDNSIMPIFLLGFEDTTIINDSREKDNFYLPKDSYIENDGDFIWLVTETPKAYYYSIKFGTHQKFHESISVDGKDVSYWGSLFEDESNIDALITLINQENNIEILQYMHSDISKRGTESQQDTLLIPINNRISQLN